MKGSSGYPYVYGLPSVGLSYASSVFTIKHRTVCYSQIFYPLYFFRQPHFPEPSMTIFLSLEPADFGIMLKRRRYVSRHGGMGVLSGS